MGWSPEQYLVFERERTRPVRDLLAAVPEGVVSRAVDLGCGPGNSTEILASRFPDAEISGLDSSPEMIAAARARLPACRFEVAGIEDWDAPGLFDLILANAVLQWVPDHAGLFPRLAGKLAPGGSLAVQMPDNFDEPTHVLMRSVASDGPWAAKLAGVFRYPRENARWYFELLSAGGARVDVWRTVYYHRLETGADGIVEWVKGSGLRPFLAPLDAAEQALFIDMYKAGVAEAYPVLADGAVLLPFPRIFMVATR